MHFLWMHSWKWSSIVLFNPIKNRSTGFRTAILDVELSAWSTCLLNFYRSHPSITGPLPAPPSVLSEHIYISPGCLTACLFLCLTCKLLCCLAVWFGLQSARHVDTLIAHLQWSPHCAVLSQLFLLLLSFSSSGEQIKPIEMMPPLEFS